MFLLLMVVSGSSLPSHTVKSDLILSGSSGFPGTH